MSDNSVLYFISWNIRRQDAYNQCYIIRYESLTDEFLDIPEH
jgi:hypothetical protein